MVTLALSPERTGKAEGAAEGRVQVRTSLGARASEELVLRKGSEGDEHAHCLPSTLPFSKQFLLPL